MKIIAISAYGKNREIGLDGKLPWSYPDEYRHYQDTVRGHYLIVGRKNYQGNEEDVAIGKPLILTRDDSFKPSSKAQVFFSPDDLWDFLKEKNPAKVFVIGGEEIYRLFLKKDWLDEMILSEVSYSGKADTYFPKFNLSDWKVLSTKEHKDFQVTHYQRL